MPQVFLTIDTELAWRHHAAGLSADDIARRSLEPAGVGVAHQLSVLARHGLKACFFVDPAPMRVHGAAPFRRLVAAILAAEQEVQLHLHAQWSGARADHRGAYAKFELVEYDEAAQRALIADARDLLREAGAPDPVAFRAGSYGADDATLRALAGLGFRYDSSHNGAEAPWPSRVGLPPRRIAPVAREGLIEVPVTVVEDAPGRLRTFQICALSSTEMAAAVDHAITHGHAATVIVGHSFELATRAGTRANRVHARRFETLCAMLAARAADAPTVHFRDAPALPLDRDDAPLPASALRRTWRRAEQAWSNLVEER